MKTKMWGRNFIKRTWCFNGFYLDMQEDKAWWWKRKNGGGGVLMAEKNWKKSGDEVFYNWDCLRSVKCIMRYL